ncbi:MAG: hypothetical protein QF654_08575 [Alphaproteobacteria bacterium]|nr:hypothetical protein [Alphaproteobacteria bacterium]
MSALGHYLEEEGLATTQISLVRPHTEKIRPPRALWVPFELGRPIGAPGHPEFQKKVMRAALALLERDAGPVLEDFPEDAPADAGPSAEGEGWVCPVALGAPPGLDAEPGSLAAALAREIHQLTPWYDLGREARGGRTTFGLAGLGIEAVGGFVTSFLDGERPDNPRPEIELGDVLKLAIEDLKNYYFEASNAQPGKTAGNAELQEWFWNETTAGEMLRVLHPVIMESDDSRIRLLGEKALIPRRQKNRAKPEAPRKAS